MQKMSSTRWKQIQTTKQINTSMAAISAYEKNYVGVTQKQKVVAVTGNLTPFRFYMRYQVNHVTWTSDLREFY